MSFKWKDIYSVGISEIDKQHQKLFEIGDHVYELVLLSDGLDHYDEIMETMQQLKDYTAYHFDCEEKLMAQCNYDRLGTHRMEHSLFIKKLDRLSGKDIDSAQQQTIIDVMTFIADWISGHILNTDHKYAAALKAAGIQ